MTDRELLELAAKAAGINAMWRPNVAEGGEWLAVPMNDGCDSWTEWNPLTDDGDALRLAVKLRIGVTPTGVAAYAEPCQPIDGAMVTVADELNIYAATRRAIVRAAAEIGRSL